MSKIVPIFDIMSKSYITTLQMPKSTVFLSKVTQLLAETRKTVHGYKGLGTAAFLLTPETDYAALGYTVADSPDD